MWEWEEIADKLYISRNKVLRKRNLLIDKTAERLGVVVKRESTGFKDSNGKEIHFGDTLKLKDRGLTGYKIDKELKMLVTGSPDFKKNYDECSEIISNGNYRK